MHPRYLVLFVYTLVILNSGQTSPPHQRLANEEFEKLVDKESKSKQEPPSSVNLDELGIEYQRYLQQVIETLESDPEFRKKLESANEADIRSGKIAEELEYVSHHVRSKLDELKRIELDRLRHLAKQYEMTKSNHIPKLSGHLDHSNPETFEIKDLQRLIYKVAEDLQEADKKRRELFKEYEMQKHFERDQKLSNMTDEERNNFYKHEKEEELKKKSMKKKVHHPGSRQQLEEVWEKQDHLDKGDFNPKVFFAMHDVDSNGYLDEDEVKALFINELNKLYPNSDLVEKDEEMERMREHVFNEIDINKDRLISWEEFYSMSLRPEFNQDQGWKSLDEQQIYTQDELDAFERNRQAEINKLVHQGKIPQHQAPMYHYSPDGLAHPQGNPQYYVDSNGVPQYSMYPAQGYGNAYPPQQVQNPQNYGHPQQQQQMYQQQYGAPQVHPQFNQMQQAYHPSQQDRQHQGHQFAQPQKHNQQFAQPQQNNQQFAQPQQNQQFAQPQQNQQFAQPQQNQQFAQPQQNQQFAQSQQNNQFSPPQQSNIPETQQNIPAPKQQLAEPQDQLKSVSSQQQVNQEHNFHKQAPSVNAIPVNHKQFASFNDVPHPHNENPRLEIENVKQMHSKT